MSNSNYRHRPLASHARREAAAVIAEVLAAEAAPVGTAPRMRWVVEAYLADGDKVWLDGYEIIGIHEEYSEAAAQANAWDERGYLDTADRPCPPCILGYRDIDLCPDCKWHMETHEYYMTHRPEMVAK